MRIYHPSKFEVAREMQYQIMGDYATFIAIPTLILNSISYGIFANNDILLWFWLVTLLPTIFFGYRKFDIRRAFIIEADEQGMRLQYYKGWFFFTQKLTDVQLHWKDIERIHNWHRWSMLAVLIAPVCNTLFIHMKNRECYTIDVSFCSTLMKTIDKELNEMLKQYGEQKEEEK